MIIFGLVNAIAGPGELALCRSGVRLRSGLSWTYLPWSAARCVKAKVTLYGEGGPHWLVMITCDSPKSLRTGGVPQPFRRRNALRIYADFPAIDRVLLYHLLRFYNEHPQARVELGTPASIDRIRSHELP
jgi:hypothetical protein